MMDDGGWSYNTHRPRCLHPPAALDLPHTATVPSSTVSRSAPKSRGWATHQFFGQQHGCVGFFFFWRRRSSTQEKRLKVLFFVCVMSNIKRIVETVKCLSVREGLKHCYTDVKKMELLSYVSQNGIRLVLILYTTQDMSVQGVEPTLIPVFYHNFEQLFI